MGVEVWAKKDYVSEDYVWPRYWPVKTSHTHNF